MQEKLEIKGVRSQEYLNIYKLQSIEDCIENKESNATYAVNKNRKNTLYIANGTSLIIMLFKEESNKSNKALYSMKQSIDNSLKIPLDV